MTARTSGKLSVGGCWNQEISLAYCYVGNGRYRIPATIAADNAGATIAYVDQMTIVDGVITVTTTGKLNADGDLMTLIFTPTTVVGSSIFVWDTTGTGCASATNSRGVACESN